MKNVDDLILFIEQEYGAPEVKQLVNLVKRYREALNGVVTANKRWHDYTPQEMNNYCFEAKEALQYTGLETPENVDEGNGV